MKRKALGRTIAELHQKGRPGIAHILGWDAYFTIDNLIHPRANVVYAGFGDGPKPKLMSMIHHAVFTHPRPVGGIEPKPTSLYFRVLAGKSGKRVVVEKWMLVCGGPNRDIIEAHRICTESEAQDWAEDHGCEFL